MVDPDRLAYWLYKNHGSRIKDSDSFQRWFNAYYSGEDFLDMPGIEDRVWDSYYVTYLEKSLHERRGGRSLRRDRLRTAKKVVTSEKDYTDARRMDLRGYDTKRAKPVVPPIRRVRRNFTRRGYQKGKVVDARKIKILTKYGYSDRWIGRNGRYVRLKKR